MHRALTIVAAAAAWLIPLNVAAQEWIYQLYMSSTGPTPWTLSTFKLTETSPGKYRARIPAPAGAYVEPCLRPDSVATVVQQQDEMIVTLEQPFRGCDIVRMVLKADGSGGRRELMQTDGSWKWDGRERVLKRK